MRIENMTNAELEHLVLKCKKGDEKSFKKILLELESVFIYYESKYFAPGEEKQDIRIVCEIATWESIKNYEIGNNNNVKQYISKCISYRIFDFVTKSNILKYKHLNDSFSNEIYDQCNDFISVDKEDPMSFEQFEQNSKPLILKAIKPIVNDMEYQIMELKLLYDFNYAEIAEILNVKTKKIDNIFARLMKKLKSEEVKKYISIELDLEYMEREIE